MVYSLIVGGGEAWLYGYSTDYQVKKGEGGSL